MYIENLNIINFRNIERANIFLNKKINFIIGDNAQGKTNLIETIYTSAFLKSFRSQNIYDLIREGENSSSIISKVIKNGVKNSVELSILKSSKKLKVNNKKPENYKYLNVVIFHPDEINYLSNYPIFRRNLIDRSIFYVNYNYINIHKKYSRCLKQRNNFLKNKSKEKDCWKDQLISYGSEIIRERIKYIEKINNYFRNDYFKKTNSEEYFISYSKKYKESQVEQTLFEEFLRKEKREFQLGYTLVGPHKEDIVFYLNGRPAETFASQGQRRSMVISFKTAQILDYKAVQGHYPVLILDDMSSELDTNRKNVLLENLLANSGQVFITSTDLSKNNYLKQSSVFKVHNGKISVAD